MLFDRNIEPCCSYCLFGTTLDESLIACIKRGIMGAGGYCPKFRYDPLKRVPESAFYRPPEGYSEEDFTL